MRGAMHAVVAAGALLPLVMMLKGQYRLQATPERYMSWG